MKKFSELGVTVQDERKMFNCSQVSISDVKTSHGEGRYLVKFKHSNGADGKFFTNAASLKKTLDQISKDAFPFSTTIKGMKCGNGKIYQFT